MSGAAIASLLQEGALGVFLSLAFIGGGLFCHWLFIGHDGHKSASSFVVMVGQEKGGEQEV